MRQILRTKYMATFVILGRTPSRIPNTQICVPRAQMRGLPRNVNLRVSILKWYEQDHRGEKIKRERIKPRGIS